MSDISRAIFEKQAEICKTMANPKRMEIIYALKSGEKAVTEIVNILGVNKANVSQHLSVMKSSGIIESRREGTHIYYSISNPKIVEACGLMREVMMEELEKQEQVIKELRKSK